MEGRTSASVFSIRVYYIEMKTTPECRNMLKRHHFITFFFRLNTSQYFHLECVYGICVFAHAAKLMKRQIPHPMGSLA